MKRFARIRTKNFTAKPLMGTIPTDHRAVVRLGSTSSTESIFGKFPKTPPVEVNTIQAIENSRSKLKMKNCFAKESVPQATWWDSISAISHDEEKLPYPLVVKRVFGFKGHGMQLLEDQNQLNTWISAHGREEGWFFEKFYNYAREYRLHVSSASGVFMSWRKLRKSDAEQRWFFNSSNSNWVGVDHELFDIPKCWPAMETAAIGALHSTGLDIGAVDIRVQSSKIEKPEFIVCEINSAPALGGRGIEVYKKEIALIINFKHNGNTN